MFHPIRLRPHKVLQAWDNYGTIVIGDHCARFDKIYHNGAPRLWYNERMKGADSDAAHYTDP
jgi:hypothetical protein